MKNRKWREKELAEILTNKKQNNNNIDEPTGSDGNAVRFLRKLLVEKPIFRT